MKKILYILVFLFVAASCFSQSVQTNTSFTFKAASGGTVFRIFGSSEADTVYVPDHAPDYTPKRAGALTFDDTTLYVFDGSVWRPVGSGGSGGAFQYHTAGFGLIGDNYNGTVAVEWQVDSTVFATINYINNFFPTDSVFNANFIVDSITNVEPSAPADSSYVLVGTAPTGVFTTHENQVAQRIGSGWEYTVPTLNDKLINAANDVIYVWNGTAWVATATPILNNGNPQNVNLRIMPHSSKNLNLATNNTNRFQILANGDINFLKFKSASIPQNNFAKFDTATGKITWDSTHEFTLTTLGSSGAATFLNGTLNIPQYSGGGNTNSNIGSGYMWAIPNTNDIKTVFNGYAIGIDSSSNTDALTLKADTSLLLTKLGAAATYQPLGNYIFGVNDVTASANRTFDLSSHDFSYNTGNITLTDGVLSVHNSNSGAATSLTASANTGFSTSATLDNVNGLQLKYGNADGYGGIRRNSGGNNAGITTIFSDSSTNNSQIEFVTDNGRDMLLDDVGNLFLNRLQSASTSDVLYYDAATKVVTYGTAPSGGGTSGLYQKITSTASQTAFSFTLIPTDNTKVGFYRNGVLLTPTTDYSISGNTLTTTVGYDSGDIVIEQGIQ